MARIEAELEQAIVAQRTRRSPNVDPSLVLRVEMAGQLLESEWEHLGLTVLSTNADRTLVLFASRDDMTAFRQRLEGYRAPAPAGQVNRSYAAFVEAIESIGSVRPSDRIGVRLQRAGIASPSDLGESETYAVDVELWEFSDAGARSERLNSLREFIQAEGGEVLDQYVGPLITVARVRAAGALIARILEVEAVAEVDLPPQADLETSVALQRTLSDLPRLHAPAGDAPLIGIIDSGVNAHPMLDGALIGSIGVPAELGGSDDYGHGTGVVGIAAFGDFRACLAESELQLAVRVCSARVLNDRGEFDERHLVPRQMREAVETLNARFGCRLFVIALGDRDNIYDGGKVGAWAATLDELVRELDVVVIVSAGNGPPRVGTDLEQAVTQYPAYLRDRLNRIVEPASALNVVTVGSLSRGDHLPPDLADSSTIRTITQQSQPSPFTRCGPGVQGSIKPDLVDTGGSSVYDGLTGSLRAGESVPEIGVLTLHHLFRDQLFRGGSGTSYAAPLVAHKAASVLARFPNASGNLIRALLCSASSVPQEAEAVLGSEEAIRIICGNGQPDAERASFSDDARVILYAEDRLALDHFAVYQVPVPTNFQEEAGRRTIRVTLSYDPPVRHTRKDYAGLSMDFRLIRGCEPELIFDHYRRRTEAEGRFPEMEDRFNCKLSPGPVARERSSLQSASITFSRDIARYGGSYYVVVRCQSGWATTQGPQRFALAVELRHEAEILLYERLQQRIQIRA